MTIDKVTTLLTAAMERHITWGEAGGLTRWLEIDAPVELAPWGVPAGMPLQYDEAPTLMELGAAYRGASAGPLTDTLEPVRLTVDARAADGAVEPHNVSWPTLEARIEKGESLTNVTFLNGGTISARVLVELYRDTDAGRDRHEMSLFDLLALLAAGDARADGRDADAATAAGLVPVMEGGQYLTITEKQGAEVLRHVPTEPESGRQYRRKAGGNITITGVTMMTDPLTNALMGRNKGHVEPVNYTNDGTVRVNTGAGGYVLLDVRADSNLDIDAAYSLYQLNDRDRFWLDALYTLAIDHKRTEIRGSEILKLRGYSNPYDESAAATMADAARSIGKAVATRIAIDVTDEKRNKRKAHAELVKSTRLQMLVNANIDLDEYEVTDDNGENSRVVRDFTVNVMGDPTEALPLATYAHARGMLVRVAPDDYTFNGIAKLTTDDRQMWAYVLRIIRVRSLRPTILFDTMWRNLELSEPSVSEYAHPSPIGEDGLPTDMTPASPELVERRRRDAVRKQHARMVKKLERMLDQKAGTHFKRWEWHKDGAGVVDGVKITRNRAAKKN